jgi:molybdate transport system substrate-binding protein
MRAVLGGLAMTLLASGTPRADELVVYGAGSLREVASQLAQDFGAARGITVKTQFGASGRMRERIEAGEKVDVFMSADVGHARKLVADGRADLMAMFARNTLCVIAPARLGLATDGVLDHLLGPNMKIGVSPPRIDPLGDYTVKLFAAADALRPGSGATLTARAVVIDSPPGTPPPRSGDNDIDAIQDGRIDTGIVYCSGSMRYQRLMPDARTIPFPAQLQVGPEYGLAVMKNAHPQAPLFALSVLSPVGQETLVRHGFHAVTLPSE